MSGQRLALSPAQESIWLEQCMRPDVTNCGFFAVTILGHVNAEAIRRTCLAITARHPALRSMISADGPCVVVGTAAAAFRFIAAGVPCPAGQERAASRAWQARRPVTWDLTLDPPARFSLLNHGDGRRTLVIDVHHIGFDGRSKFVFAREFARLLPIMCGDDRAAVADVPAAAAPQVHVAEEDVESAARYWLARGIAELPGLVLPLPATREPHGVMASTGITDVPEQTCRVLADLARAEGTTFFGGLLAALSAQLWTYGNDHAVVAVTADTSTAQTRQMIGPDVNVVPCFIPLAGTPSFRDLIAASREALGHVAGTRHLPFHLLLRRLRLRTGAEIAQARFGSLSVSYPRMPDDLGKVPGLDLRWDMFAPNSSRSFDLVLQLRRPGDAAFGRLDYSTAIADQPTARDFMSMFGETLKQAAAPDQRLRARGSVAQPTAGRAAAVPAQAMPAWPAWAAQDQVVYPAGVLTADDVRLAADKIRQSAPGEPVAVTLASPLDRDQLLALLAAITAGLPVRLICRGDSQVLMLSPQWAASQREAAPALHGALGGPRRIVNLHAPGSEPFAAVLARGLATRCRVDIPDEQNPLADGLLPERACGTLIEGPVTRISDLAALAAGRGLGPDNAVAVPMTQFLATRMLEGLGRRARVLLHLSDARSGLLGWSLLGSPADDDSWSVAPRIRYPARALCVMAHGRQLPEGVPGTLAAATADGSGDPAAFECTPYRAWLKDGVMRYLGLTSNHCAETGVAGLEEAERLLAQLPGVAEAAVTWHDPTGRFIVMLVPERAAPAAADSPASSWRSAIRRGWPEHGYGAVPRRVLLAEALPRTRAGDIDRPALRMLTDP